MPAIVSPQVSALLVAYNNITPLNPSTPPDLAMGTPIEAPIRVTASMDSILSYIRVR